jgi:hypothetical protein
MWTVRGDGVVIGRVGHNEAAYIRREINSLRRISRGRLDSAPVLKPFGEQVAVAVSAALPTDARLRVLLADFVGEDEPEWVWRWHERELWEYLESCAESALRAWVYAEGDEDRAPTRIELDDSWMRVAFFQSVRAIAAIAGHRIETEPDSERRDLLEHVHRWFVTAAESLNKLSDSP